MQALLKPAMHPMPVHSGVLLIKVDTWPCVQLTPVPCLALFSVPPEDQHDSVKTRSLASHLHHYVVRGCPRWLAVQQPLQQTLQVGQL